MTLESSPEWKARLNTATVNTTALCKLALDSFKDDDPEPVRFQKLVDMLNTLPAASAIDTAAFAITSMAVVAAEKWKRPLLQRILRGRDH